MSTFAKTTFNSKNYLSHRPYYTNLLYKILYDYHKLPFGTAVDLGCGPGIVTEELSKKFHKVIGTDPSEKMLSAVHPPEPQDGKPPIEYKVATAENLSFIESNTVDMVTAGQAAHWFNYDKCFPEIARVLKPGGTLAFFCYGNVEIVGHPELNPRMRKYVYGGPGTLGPYWEEPGRSIVVSLYRDIKPPTSLYQDEKRCFFPRDNEAGEREQILVISGKMTFEIMHAYTKTWSSYHGWKQAFPDRKSREEGGEGDIADEMFDELKEVTGWSDTDEFNVEWQSGILLARKREDL